jgi:hypothetical protein
LKLTRLNCGEVTLDVPSPIRPAPPKLGQNFRLVSEPKFKGPPPGTALRCRLHRSKSLRQIDSQILPKQEKRGNCTTKGRAGLAGEDCGSRSRVALQLQKNKIATTFPRRHRPSPIAAFARLFNIQSLPNLSSNSLANTRTTISRSVAKAATQRPAKGTATMSAFSSPHGYQSMHSPNGDLQLPGHHGLPPPPQAYPNPYDPQSVTQIQSPSAYSNGHTNGHGEGDAQHAIPPPPPASATGGDAQKGNRLRKACDSCSLRKVKVVHSFIAYNKLKLTRNVQIVR